MQTNQSKATDSSLIARIAREFHPNSLLPSLTAGLVAGVIVILVEISLATLIFSGNLANFAANGIGLMLFGAVVMGVVTSLLSSFPGVISLPQDSPVAILAVMAATIAATFSGVVAPDKLYLLILAAISFTTILSGLFYFLLGQFRLGRFVRFIPYPVIGGFLAGSGWLLFRGSIGVMADVSLSMDQLPTLLQVDIAARWLPGVIFAVVLYTAIRRFSHLLIMPGVIIGAIGLFYLVLMASGTSVTAASEQGWLLGPFPQGGLWQIPPFADLLQVNWDTILAQSGSVLAILLVGVVALLLNASGLELATEQDIDLNRELKVAGIANFLAGLGGSPAGYMALSLSALGTRMGVRSRLVGLIVALLCAAILLAGAAVLSFIPKLIVGGILMFLGIAFLVEWVIDGWSTLPKADYVVMLFILLVIGSLGFLEGVGLGIILTVVLFVINYSRINVVKHNLSGKTYPSDVDRSAQQRALLIGHGDQTLILELQGFVFFGTANSLLDKIAERLKSADLPPLKHIVLDFRQVTGIDSSALLSFRKLLQLAGKTEFQMVFTELSSTLENQFQQGGLPISDEKHIRTYSELDMGVEWCEDQLLSAATLELDEPALYERLAQVFPAAVDVNQLHDYLQAVDFPEGHYLMQQGDPAGDIFFIEHGWVSAYLKFEDGRFVRLRKMGAGTVVGEQEMYLGTPRAASVISDSPIKAYRLTAEAMQRMETETPELSSAIHKFMARMQAERVLHTNQTLEALLH